MKKVQGAFYTKTGKASDVLQIGRFDIAEPEANEVQLEIITSGINPSDVKTRNGLRGELTYPYIIPHSDGAGIIRQIGNKVTDFKIGDRVWVYNAAWNRNVGTACETINIAASLVVPLPENVSFETGACLGVPGLTAAAALLSLNCKAGDRIMITGGAGSVGMLAIQLAKILGFKVITTVSSQAKADIAIKAGADYAINYTKHNVVDAVMPLTADQGIDGLIDVDFGANIAWSIEVLKPHTTIATYASASVPNPVFPFYQVMFKQIKIQPIFVYILPDELRLRSIDLIQKACQENLLTPLIHAIYPLTDIILAHEAVENNQKLGQVLLTLNPQM
jgi:NADPH2:quinone reductase